jgi:hypothetical protein
MKSKARQQRGVRESGQNQRAIVEIIKVMGNNYNFEQTSV